MIKKITFVFALFVALSGTAFASAASSTAAPSMDGSDDLIEAWGGTRNGGDC